MQGELTESLLLKAIETVKAKDLNEILSELVFIHEVYTDNKLPHERPIEMYMTIAHSLLLKLNLEVESEEEILASFRKANNL